MIYSEFRFTLDIRALTSQVSLGVKKGETGRRLRIHLTENGYPYHIPDNCYAVFTAKKPDGNKIFNDCVIQDCEIFYDVTEQTVSTTGLLPCAINLYGVEGELLISATFQMIVYSAPVDQSDIESTSEYKALATLIAEAQALKDDMEEGGTGGYYIPLVDQPSDDVIQFAWKASSEDLPALPPVAVLLPDNSGNDSSQNVNGLTAVQIAALNGMFEVAAYDDSKDVAGAYAAFKAAFGLTDSEGDDSGTTESVAYTISRELVNVTANNSIASVTEGASYIVTLTAADGYTLDTVTVLMGGADITADAYADGVVSIASVTGKVEIMASAVAESGGSDTGAAELNTDGLLGLFDLRNVAASEGNGSTGYYLPATVGDGRLYSWSVSSGGNEYGIKAKGYNFCNGAKYDAHSFGAEFTWIVATYCDQVYTPASVMKFSSPTNIGITVTPTYNIADGTATATSDTSIGKVAAGYHYCVIRVDGPILRVYIDGEQRVEYNGAEYDGFVSWHDKLVLGDLYSYQNTVLVHSSLAGYDRALTDVELVEMLEYMKTLEVAA